MTARVLIVDDHPGFRRHAKAMLVAEGLDVVGEAVDGSSAVAAAAELHPDVILLDVGLPGGDGISWCDAIATACSGAAVVFTSSREASDYGTRLTRATRAAGFVPKGELSADVLRSFLGERAS